MNLVAIDPITKKVIASMVSSVDHKFATTYNHPKRGWLQPYWDTTTDMAKQHYADYLKYMKHDSKVQNWTKEELTEAKQSLQMYNVTVAVSASKATAVLTSALPLAKTVSPITNTKKNIIEKKITEKKITETEAVDILKNVTHRKPTVPIRRPVASVEPTVLLGEITGRLQTSKPYVASTPKASTPTKAIHKKLVSKFTKK